MHILNLPEDGPVRTYNPKEAVDLIVEEVEYGNTQKVGKGEHVREYSDVVCTFDIETTKLLNDDWQPPMSEQYHYFNFCFCWQAMVNGYYIEGGEASEFFDMLHAVGERIGNVKLLWWVHNLAFESNNLADYFYQSADYVEGFWKSASSPLYIRHNNHEFRCSAQLTHKSLATLGSEVDMPKLKGDFDYSVMRDVTTEQSPIEHNYRYRDVAILYRFIKKETEFYCKEKGYQFNPCRLPYTQTGYVRRDMQENFSRTPEGYSVLKRTELTRSEYESICPGFFGGYVHGNFRVIGEPITDPFLHVDIVSAYPWAMVTKKFMWHFTESNLRDVNVYLDNLLHRPDYGQFGDFILVDVDLKKGHVPYIPYIEGSSKVMCENPIYENGKIIRADSVALTCIDTDMRLILANYNVKKMKIRKLWTGHKRALPFKVIETVLNYYEKKTTLKGIHSEDGSIENLYQLSKQKLNSCYGMAATALIHVQHYLEGINILPGETEYKASDTLPYQFALQITAYVREVTYGIITWLSNHKGQIAYYSDTDSVFAKDTPEFRAYLEKYNRQRVAELEELQKKFFNIIPKNRKGVPQYLGTLGLEEDCINAKMFMTIGAKRYMIMHEDGMVDITFSGLRATKCYYDRDNRKHEGRNTVRLKEKYGSIENAFREIVKGDVVLPYEDGTDKMSNYNVRYPFRNVSAFGREIKRPCSYTLYGQGTRLSLNESLANFMKNDLFEEVW